MTRKIVFAILSLVAAATLFGAVVHVGFKAPASSVSIGTTTQQVTAPPPPAAPPAVVWAPYASSTTGYLYKYSYPSLDGRLSLELYTYENPQTYDSVCRFRVVGTDGHKYAVDRLLGTDIIGGCDPENREDFWNTFGGWVDGERVILPGGDGEIRIVDPAKLTVETYHFDASKMYFVAVSRSLKYWLFRRDPDWHTLVILDQQSNIVLDDITSYSNALYDTANDGFVLIAFDQVSSSTRSLRLDFLPASTMKLRNILRTDPYAPAQRGGERSSLSSKPGEIIFSPGFGGLDMKYFGPGEGSILIKL